jgi:hypothetical protein
MFFFKVNVVLTILKILFFKVNIVLLLGENFSRENRIELKIYVNNLWSSAAVRY